MGLISLLIPITRITPISVCEKYEPIIPGTIKDPVIIIKSLLDDSEINDR